MLSLLRRLISPTNPLRLAWHFLWELLFVILYRFPARKLIVIGVTGTNGKTTTANLIANILEANGKSVALATTINFQIGSKKWDNLTKKTTLGRGGVNRFLRRAVDAGCTYAVIEVSSHGLVQHRLLGVDFDAGILTNITHEHLDFHGTFEAYREAKAKLFWNLAKNRKGGEKVAILPAEDESLSLFQRIPLEGMLTFGQRKGDLTVKNLQVTDTGQHFTLNGWKNDFEIQTQLLGNFNVLNIIAAAGVCLSLGVQSKIIQQALKNFATLPGRLEPVEAGQSFRVIVDFAHTPDALEKLLRTFRAVTPGRIWLVFGATGDRDREKRPVMGEIANRLADEIVLTSDDTYTEDPIKIISEVTAGIKRRQGERFYAESDRTKAIDYALANAKKGDTVLLAGKGCEQFQVVGNRKIPWSDKDLAEKILRVRFSKAKK